MKKLEGITINGESLSKLKCFHQAQIVSVNGEKLLRVPYYNGFETKFTYGRVGDILCCQDHNDFCIPRYLYEEFSEGWFKYDTENKIDPFVEYYEVFARKHADKIIQEPQTMKFNIFVLRVVLLLIALVVALVYLIKLRLFG